MILHKETFKKFGYWPNSLPTFSKKPTIRKCNGCGSVRIVSYAKVGIGDFCQPCSLSDRNRKAKPRIQLTEETFQLPSFETLIDIVMNGSLRTALKPSAIKNGRTGRWGLVYRSAKRRHTKALPTIQVLSLIKELGISEPDIKNKAWKIKIQKYVLSKYGGFNTMNYILTHYRTLMKKNPAREQDGYMLSDSGGYLRLAMDNVGFKFKQIKTKTGTLLKIERGSFYINNQWIHIG